MPTENSKVLVVLDRKAALETLKCIPRPPVTGSECRAIEALIAGLEAEQEERREHSVLAGGVRQPANSLSHAEDLARSYRFVGAANVRQQYRTITQLPDGQFISGWRDLGGDDA